MNAPPISPPLAINPRPRFFEALSFEELGVTIGVRHVAGAGYRVVMRSASEERHMSVAAARRLAGELKSDDPEANALLAYMAEGLRKTADQLHWVLTKPVEGNA